MEIVTYHCRCNIIIYIPYVDEWHTSDLTTYFHLNRGLTSVGSFVFVCNSSKVAHTPSAYNRLHIGHTPYFAPSLQQFITPTFPQPCNSFDPTHTPLIANAEKRSRHFEPTPSPKNRKMSENGSKNGKKW